MADDSSDGSDKDRSAPTVRDLKGPAVGDTLPDLIGMYVPPRPLPETSQHRTLDLKSVRLSDQADPRRALTERRLVSPARRTGGSLRLGLALAGLVLVGALAWFFLGAPPPSVPTAPLAAPAAPAPVSQPSAAAPKALVTTPPVSTPPPVIAPSKPSGLSTEASPAPAPKTSRPRESAKKRKDPWLE
jgi:hypothetical protein